METLDIQRAQQRAEQFVRQAGKRLVTLRHKAKIVKSKADALDIVTEADEASEQILVSALQKEFPSHNILSEESGDHQKKSAYTWVMDPLDGTREYARGLPQFSVNLSLQHNEDLLLGLCYFPVFDELYVASTGNGTYLNGKAIHVSHISDLQQSIINCHPPRNNLTKDNYLKLWRTIEHIGWKTYRTRANAFDAYSLSMVASGALEGFYITYPYPKWWDIASGIILVQEAGGKITTSKGSVLTYTSFKKEGLLASNGHIHHELLTILKT